MCKILKFRRSNGDRYCEMSEKNIHYLITNRTKEFCQNFKLSLIVVKKHLDINFETKIVEIHLKVERDILI